MRLSKDEVSGEDTNSSFIYISTRTVIVKKFIFIYIYIYKYFELFCKRDRRKEKVVNKRKKITV